MLAYTGRCRLFEFDFGCGPSVLLVSALSRLCVFASLFVVVGVRANGKSELVLVALRRYRSLGQLLAPRLRVDSADRLRAAHIKLCWLGVHSAVNNSTRLTEFSHLTFAVIGDSTPHLTRHTHAQSTSECFRLCYHSIRSVFAADLGVLVPDVLAIAHFNWLRPRDVIG